MIVYISKRRGTVSIITHDDWDDLVYCINMAKRVWFLRYCECPYCTSQRLAVDSGSGRELDCLDCGYKVTDPTDELKIKFGKWRLR